MRGGDFDARVCVRPVRAAFKGGARGAGGGGGRGASGCVFRLP